MSNLLSAVNININRNTEARIRVIVAVALWMVLTTVPGFLEFGLEKRSVPMAWLELALYFGMMITASGLFLRQEWARRWAIRILCLYFGWTLYVVCFLLGPSFSASLQWLSVTFGLPHNVLKNFLLALVIIYITWPIIIIYFLSFPRIKLLFDPDYDPVREAEAA